MIKATLFLFSNAWLRRGILVLMGLLMSWGYFEQIILTPFYEPICLSILIGLFSLSLFRSFINSVIVLLSMILLILILAVSTQLGAEMPFRLESYLDIITITFEKYSLPFLMFLVGIPVGNGLRVLILKAFVNKKSQS